MGHICARHGYSDRVAGPGNSLYSCSSLAIMVHSVQVPFLQQGVVSDGKVLGMAPMPLYRPLVTTTQGDTLSMLGGS